MKKNTSILLVLFILAALAGCTNETSSKAPKKYFDLDGFIKAQIAVLEKSKPTIKKLAEVNDKSETISTKNINWQHELELFLQADINKQAYLLSYDSLMTESTVTYTLKKGEKSPVKTLSISYYDSQLPSRVVATMNTSNYLYDSEKNVSLHLVNGKLKSYQIEGFQKMFVGDKKTFLVKGEVE